MKGKMTPSSESISVQRPFIRYTVEVGWMYLSPDEALNQRLGGVTSRVLGEVLLGHGNPGSPLSRPALAAWHGDHPIRVNA